MIDARELYELECMKCGHRIFEYWFIDGCVKVSNNKICNGKNRVKSVGMVR